MPCYHPISVEYKGKKINGKGDFHMSGVQGIHEPRYLRNDPRDLLVPCRRCIGCRLDYSRRWADRLMLELDHSKTALFFTLTYDNEHITLAEPVEFDPFSGELLDIPLRYGTLVKRDLQLFNKRLREYFSGKEIRFFAAGEYGDNTLRPHYHGIYFGLSLSDFPDSKLLFANEHKQPIYTSDLLRRLWKNGNVSIGRVSWQSCAYVARYNLKKLANGNDDFTLLRNCLPEFGLMSRRPGIAGYFPFDHPEFFENPTDKIFLHDDFGVSPVESINLPSYLFEKLNAIESKEMVQLGIVNPELYATIKAERDSSSTFRFLDELSKTDLDEFEYLANKERKHEKSVQSLKRPL